MALTIATLLEVSAVAAMQAYGKKYELGPVREFENRGYVVTLRDPITNISIPLIWTFDDETKANTENKKIQLVRDLLVNGADCLSDMIEQGVDYVVGPPDPGEDVINEG